MDTDQKIQIIARAILNLAEFTSQVYEDDDRNPVIGGKITDYADQSLIEALKEIAK